MSSELLYLLSPLLPCCPSFPQLSAKERASSVHGESHLYHDRAVNTAKTLPAAQLFGERAARAVGDIPETEVFVDLE